MWRLRGIHLQSLGDAKRTSQLFECLFSSPQPCAFDLGFIVDHDHGRRQANVVSRRDSGINSGKNDFLGQIVRLDVAFGQGVGEIGINYAVATPVKMRQQAVPVGPS
jgi:hypothetical protein